MNRKLTLLLCLMTIIGTKLSAQNESHYGLYLGCSANTSKLSANLYYDDSEVFTSTEINGVDTSYLVKYLPVDDAKVIANLGFVIGGYYEYEISKKLGLQFHVLYNQYGYFMEGKVDRPDIGDDNSVIYDYNAKMKMSNISAAVLLKINVWKENMSVDLGVQPSYCFKAVKETTTGISHKSVIYDSKNDFNALNVCGSLGLTWYYFDTFFLSAKVNLGLLNVLKAKEPYITNDAPEVIKYKYSDTTSKTNSIIVTVGYRFD